MNKKSFDFSIPKLILEYQKFILKFPIFLEFPTSLLGLKLGNSKSWKHVPNWDLKDTENEAERFPTFWRSLYIWA